MNKKRIIIDGHIHYCLPVKPEEIFKMLDYTSTDKGNLVVLYDRRRSTGLLECLQAKDLSNGRLYVYGALDVTTYFRHNENVGKEFVHHVDNLLKCGCDGIKMLEGKPTSRNFYPIPNFDSDSWEMYWDYMEKKGVPIVWHVNDPEEFWDINKVPQWALASGWFYGKDSVNNIDQYNQIYNVLKRHPKLKIIFAHFYFLSAQLDKLGSLLDEFENIGVDITPGIEMFQNFTKDVKKAKAFFEKYQDRIYYGTDISGDPSDLDNENVNFDYKDSTIRASLCRDYISKKEPMYMKGDEKSLLGKDDFTLLPLGLSEEIQDKILGDNFYKLNGEPNKLNYKEILEEAKRVREEITYLASLPYNKGNMPNYKAVDITENYFKSKLNK